MPNEVEVALAPEVRLMLACSRWPQPEESLDEIRQIAGAGVAWEQVLVLCRHHRVQPLVYRSLMRSGLEIPPEAGARLKGVATHNAIAAMRYLVEVQQIRALLEGAGGVPVRVLKGVPLSQDAFGDISLREVGDIDLLIPPGREEKADELLGAQGWIRIDPAARLTARRRRSVSKHAKDYTYAPGGQDGRPARGNFELDLHWRLFRNRYMSGNGLAAPATERTVRVGEMSLSVLGREASLLYLCVHGALDGWFRLKSLVDIAALWSQLTAEEKDQSVCLARQHMVVSELSAALLLARIFTLVPGKAVPDALLLQESDGVVQRIVHYALDSLLRSQFLPSSSGEGSWSLKRYEASLRSGAAYRAEIVLRVLFRPRVWESFDLPDALFPLYALLSPVEWWMHKARSVPAQRRPIPGKRPGRWRQAWRRLRQSSFQDLALLAEAGALLVTARIALKLLPVRRIVSWVQRRAAVERGVTDAETVGRVRWAILSFARYAPLRLVCFPQALAAHAMLRRRHIASEIVYGVRRSAEGKLRAHTWVTVAGSTLLGGENAQLFWPLDAWSPSLPH